jgi:hypothetical protein
VAVDPVVVVAAAGLVVVLAVVGPVDPMADRPIPSKCGR